MHDVPSNSLSKMSLGFNETNLTQWLPHLNEYLAIINFQASLKICVCLSFHLDLF